MSEDLQHKRRVSLIAAIRRHLIDTPEFKRVALHGPTLTRHNALLLRHVVNTVRLTKAFMGEDGKPLPQPLLRPIIADTLATIPGVRHLSGMEARASGLATSAAVLVVNVEEFTSNAPFLV